MEEVLDLNFELVNLSSVLTLIKYIINELKKIFEHVKRYNSKHLALV